MAKDHSSPYTMSDEEYERYYGIARPDRKFSELLESGDNANLLRRAYHMEEEPKTEDTTAESTMPAPAQPNSIDPIGQQDTAVQSERISPLFCPHKYTSVAMNYGPKIPTLPASVKKIERGHALDDTLGSGTYGVVYKARDRRTLQLVAVKANRRLKTTYREPSNEVRILEMIKLNDPEDKFRCLRIKDAFELRGHVCIVTHLHDKSLMDFMETQLEECDDRIPLPLSQVRCITRQLLASVSFLHRMGIVHADIKLDNIVLLNCQAFKFQYQRQMPSVSTKYARWGPRLINVLALADIRLIDFGCAVFEKEDAGISLKTSRLYWPPEAIAGQEWSSPVDIWSIGCMMIELFTGQPPFGQRYGIEFVARMQRMLGSFDADLVRRWEGAIVDGDVEQPMFRDGSLNFPVPGMKPSSLHNVECAKKLEDIVNPTMPCMQHFVDLLRQMLEFDPEKRIKASDALEHPWFKCPIYADEGTAAAQLAWRLPKAASTGEKSYDTIYNEVGRNPHVDMQGRIVITV
ncbi:protein kinase [Grosmannia clavigera kw1407]|uniref:Protein kinase n=1 Tax=Grosmannia clavigera (strain kw1407 / UAMH 11150) TaxID=655863 RepID=F0XB31_GROCL|nr:protein kinase [Grosmannia clavigera kw1407]EFX04960.1 protein kinase [Grosmannia clavigera kw1407]